MKDRMRFSISVIVVAAGFVLLVLSLGSGSSPAPARVSGEHAVWLLLGGVAAIAIGLGLDARRHDA
jgi:hypothetical protein